MTSLPPPSRLQIGRDVPWITSWSQEAQLGVRPCPTVDGALAVWQAEQPGVGRPLYSRNHLRRQRVSVRSMLCPMCGEPTQEGDRWSQTGRFSTAGKLRERGFSWALPARMADAAKVLDAGSIAPLHGACARASLDRCPHLGGMEDRALKVFPKAWVVIPLMVPAAAPNVLAARPPPPAVAFLQLVGICDAAA
jgi:hypothetical protein